MSHLPRPDQFPPLVLLCGLGVAMTCWVSCGSRDSSLPLFQLMDATHTGINFQNTVIADDSMNLLTFEYLYNGGGVGVGDFNRDGRPDLFFTGNVTGSNLYLNGGDLRFTDVTKESGISTAGTWCTGVTVVDINSDGFDDIYVSVGGPARQSIYPNLLYVNQGDATFREAAGEYGLDNPGESNHAVFFDYDRDGDLDMYLLNGGGFERSAVTIKPMLTDGTARNTDVLYENTYSDSLGHPVFTDVSRRAGITFEGFGLGVGIIDANHDRWPDVYVSNDYLSRDLLYLNNQDGTFSEAADRYFAHTSFFSMGNCVGDVDNDGNFDLVTLDMLPEDHFRRMTMFGPNQHARFRRALDYGYGHQYMRNMLQLGEPTGRFREVGQLAGIDRTDWSWAPLLADFDNDGLQDLYITNGYGKNITDLDFVKFRQDAVDPFSSPEDIRKLLLRSLEQLPAIVLPNYAYRNTGNATFDNATNAWGFNQPSISNGAVYVDLDLDGDLEIVTNNLNAGAFVYRNTLREQSGENGHYVQVELSGTPANAGGFGAQVTVHVGATQQHRYQQPASGYQSSGSTRLHFGLGRDSIMDSLRVVWPDERENVLYNIPADRLVTVDYATASPPQIEAKLHPTLLQSLPPLAFEHQEVIAPSDFSNQPLLQHGLTTQGPGVAVGDVNGDGLDDLFLGGAYGSPAGLLLQTSEGTFEERLLPTEDYEDLGALFLDVDTDGDLDLYVTSGGTERYADHPNYQDRIYRNDGTGNFTLTEGQLPTLLASTATVTGGDFDRDGRTDLFVGGRVVPGQYPTTPRSYLLRNTGAGFEDVTARVCPGLQFPGMVTSALWTDYNNDHLPDLIVVGEFMRIRVFRNDGARLTEVTDQFGLSQSSGMWNSLTAGDFDHDGDTDYVVGNIGRNTPFDAFPDHPLQLHYADFDRNGTTDPIFSQFEEGKYYPAAPFDLLAEQLPRIKKDILYYHEYARATTSDILALLDTAGMQTLSCAVQSSVLLENVGGEKFSIHPLPFGAQAGPVLGVIAEDLDKDGDLDLLLVGNDREREVISGSLDASTGTVLENTGGLNFRVVPSSVTGLHTTGNNRGAVRLSRGSREDMIVLPNNQAAPECYTIGTSPAVPQEAFRPGEISTTLELADGRTRKVEHSLGGGYLSQTSGTIRIPVGARSVTFYDAVGRTVRTINLSPHQVSR
ncbi:FG-GAP-like repeat-containing protein [Lewinella sp. JB7]|uniref:VCBS repeat-containing protein n=1 Tax=Lewinella sp. JB7 TaxID=2962887 RepID=UPI0020CA022B|nr:VCBS repeat-containing protein [Lewinella sp. JB7]